MARRKHTDLSNEEPGLRADPVMETLNIKVTPTAVTFGTSTHRDSRLSAGAVSLIVLAGVLGCGAGAGALAFWVGMGATGCMISAAVGAAVSLVVTAAIFRTKTRGQGAALDYTPETRPPVSGPGKKRKAGKKRKKRR
ncbi:hypothetical protein AB0G51_20270 [Streptomyces asoensis]|uniref:hypothetical protein n=1 Tax=Streptomyces asoensis TaxID=249586 RepID=UPI0033C89014